MPFNKQLQTTSKGILLKTCSKDSFKNYIRPLKTVAWTDVCPFIT